MSSTIACKAKTYSLVASSTSVYGALVSRFSWARIFPIPTSNPTRQSAKPKPKYLGNYCAPEEVYGLLDGHNSVQGIITKIGVSKFQAMDLEFNFQFDIL